MNAKERRQAIVQMLKEHPSTEALNATVISKTFGVSRQIIVGDIALLRSAGHPILSTARGYYYRDQSVPQGKTYTIVCCHGEDGLEYELNTIVDFGGECVDVIVDHPFYGRLTGELNLTCRYEVQHFCAQIAASQSKPLSILTEGVHTHHVRFHNNDAFSRCCRALKEKGMLLSTEED